MNFMRTFLVKTLRLALILVPLMTVATLLACYYTGSRSPERVSDVIFVVALIPVLLCAILVASTDLAWRKNQLSFSILRPPEPGPAPSRNEARLGEELWGFVSVLLISSFYFAIGILALRIYEI